MQTNKENLIVSLRFEFAKRMIHYTEQLERLKKYNLSNQLFRAGTSIGANVRESKNDFIHKLKIAAKEADETEYWLMLCKEAESYPECSLLITQIESIQKVLSKIIATSKTAPNHQITKSSN